MEENKRLTIKSWAEEDRPREKMIEKGASVLSDAELVAIILGSGTREMTAVDSAKNLLNGADNDLNKLGKMSIRDLQKFKGIGAARAVTVAAAMELGRRRKDYGRREREKITHSKDVQDIFYPLLSDLPYEEFWMLFLNKSNSVITKVKISMGSTDQAVIDMKIIAKSAVECLASSAIAVHNHPSGNMNPSKHDISLTAKIREALAFFGIPLLDHIIISDDRYYSFADEGIIDN
ncbi:MAG: DNA repair protein RadC [Prevotellaceae bacterium]|jgi:DNA repair protein RadC|nr:DNA repair protein RadC [Prevotellaceae bacterium]